MNDLQSPLTRRVEVTDAPLRGDASYDYADAFVVRVPEPDDRSAEEWMRCGLEGSPRWLRRAVVLIHRHVLGFRLAPPSSPDHVLGWTIVESRADVIQLEAISRLGRGVLLGRRVDETSTMLTTFLFMTRPRTVRVIWAVIGPVHRRVAPYLLERAAAAGSLSDSTHPGP